MLVKIQQMLTLETYDITDVSKAMLVRKFKKKVKEITGVEVKHQNLYFGGKLLNDDCDLCDYKIENGYKIQMQVRQPLEPITQKTSKQNESSSSKSTETLAKEEKMDNKLSKEEEEKLLLGIGGQDLVNDLAAEEPEEPCKKCKDDTKKKCKECGCSICGGKEQPEVQLFCEECNYVTHMFCLDPPLETIPEDDWYCPLCKNDDSEIVGKGQRVKYSNARAKMPSRQREIKRDWGRGMATAGRTKTNTSIEKGHFGPIPGIEVGMSWEYRMQASEVGVHAPPVAGISGTQAKGCNSLVLAGGYEDETDKGEELTYIGSGGRDLSGNRRVADQSFDQTLTKSNAAIAVSCNAQFNNKDGAESTDWRKGKPIRVLRSYKFKKHSKFAPDVGVRYDGIYKVVKYYPEKGKSGFIVWKFLLRRDDKSPAPWKPEARKYKCIMKSDGAAATDAGKKITKFANSKDNNKKSDEISKKPEDDQDFDESYDIEGILLDLIKDDTRNKKLWDEIIAYKVRKDVWYEKVREDFSCFACYELVLDPITLPCNHNCCKKCLKKSLKEGHKECWLCRYKLEEDVDINQHFNKELFAIMQWMFPKHIDEDHENNVKACSSQSKVSSNNGKKRKNAEGNDEKSEGNDEKPEGNDEKSEGNDEKTEGSDSPQSMVSTKKVKRKNVDGNDGKPVVASKRSRRVKTDVDYNEF